MTKTVSTDAPPPGYTEFRFRRWRNGRDFGTERIFILGTAPLLLFTLLNNWTRRGQGEKIQYSYTAELP